MHAHAIDINPDAITLALDNAARCGISTAVDGDSVISRNTFTASCADMLHPAFPDLFRARGRFHLLTSNPPYISRLQYDSLALSVKKFEDQRALLADEGGLAFYHAIAKLARRGNILTSDGLVVLEVGDDQAKAVQEIMQAVGGFSKTEIWLDPCGKERVVLATNSTNLTN